MPNQIQKRQRNSLESSLRLDLPPKPIRLIACQACNGTGRCYTNDIGASGTEYLFRADCLVCHGRAFVNG